jgi:CDC45-like protein
MIYEIEDWCLGYSRILKECRSRANDGEEGSVHIYCNADADGLSAARIFTLMLRNDGITYQLVPCRSYSQLVQNVQKLGSSSSIVRALVLLNLGATRNLTRLFSPSRIAASPTNDNATEIDETVMVNMLDPDETTIYVFDCRRPVHLGNVYASNNVVIFWDVQNVDEVPSDGDNLSGNESSDDSSSDESSSSISLEDGSEDEGENEFIDNNDDDDEFNVQTEDINNTNLRNKNTSEDTFDFDEGSARRKSGNHSNPASDDEDINDAGASDDNWDGKRSKRRRQTLETVANTTMSQSSSIEDNDEDIHDDNDGDSHLNIVHSRDVNDIVEIRDNEDASLTVNKIADAYQGQTMTQRELFEQRRDRIRAYYNEGKFYGSPASYVAYKIASELRFGDTSTNSSSSTDILWLACIGITDAYLHARLDISGYSALALQLRTHIHKIFPNDDFDRITNSVYAESLLWNAPTNKNTNQSFTRISFSENGKLLSESDFRFFLLRHSSLYDAMVYSDFISSKFQLSTAKGLHRLHEMFAKMGFPLSECQQPFAYMKPKLKRQLHTKLMQNAEAYNLGNNFEYTSFFRITGYSSLLSASDVSYAITALLEFDPTSSAMSGDKGHDEDYNEDEKIMHSFNIAFDALNVNAHNSLGGKDATYVQNNSMNDIVTGGALSGSSGLGAGIRLAMSQQKLIMSTAFGLINRSAITRLNHFRYAYITCTSQAGGAESYNKSNQRLRAGIDDLAASSNEERMIDHIFAKPLTLTRLAHYLMDVHRENGKWVGAKSRPLVLLAEKPITQSYVVVGYECPENTGDILKNTFGKNFELASQSMNGKFLFDSFDSNVVEVARVDVQRFIEQLHYLMETLSKSND